jgi:hypothetical protein
MNVGLGIKPGSDGKLLIVMEILEPNVNVSIALTDETNYLTDIDKIIHGLSDIKAEMRRQKSGLTVVKGIPDGLSAVPQQEGRGKQQPRRSGKQGTRPAQG